MNNNNKKEQKIE